MNDAVTTMELQDWLGISNPTVIRLRTREHDPLPAPDIASGREHHRLYSREAIKAWIARNPRYPQIKQTRKGRAAMAAENSQVLDRSMANAFLTGRRL